MSWYFYIRYYYLWLQYHVQFSTTASAPWHMAAVVLNEQRLFSYSLLLHWWHFSTTSVLDHCWLLTNLKAWEENKRVVGTKYLQSLFFSTEEEKNKESHPILQYWFLAPSGTETSELQPVYFPRSPRRKHQWHSQSPFVLCTSLLHFYLNKRALLLPWFGHHCVIICSAYRWAGL